VLIPPDRLIICSGFVQGLGLVTRALRDRGVARMAMEDPCIPEHRTIVGASGLAVRPLLVDGDGAQVAELARLGVGAVTLTPAHQAILGVTLSPTRRADVLAWARTTGGLVLEDDYDGEFRFDRQPVGALQGLDAHRVIYAGTASKTLMPGLRLAWLAVPSDWLEPVVEAKRLADRHTGILDQLALAELLASGAFDRHIRRMRIQYRRRRDYVVGALAERVPALQPSSIAAGLHLVIELPRDWPSEGEVIRRAAERGIAILGVQRGWHGGQLGPQAIMVGYAAPPDHAFPAAVRALVNVLADCAPVRSR
jgi:GntR family transcriptional regulator/MocR family aminotransferase